MAKSQRHIVSEHLEKEIFQTMTGINPNTGQKISIMNINGLALYNDGNNEVQFISNNNIAALTATFTK